MEVLKMRKYLVIFLLLISVPSSAGDYCVDPAGGGDGTNWDGGCLQWSSFSPVRGNTYYLADGTYGPKTLSTADSGSVYIYIKKATESAHGPATGWSSSMGNGVAYFTATASDNALTFSSSYWDVDGVTGYFKGANEPYGIEIEFTSTGESGSAIIIPTNVSVHHLNFKHLKIYSSNAATKWGGGFNLVTQTGTAGWHDINVQYCYLNEVVIPFALKSVGTSNASDITVEHCVIRNNYSNQTSPGHSEAFSNWSLNNFILRYSWLESIMGTSYIANNYNPVSPCSGWEIYGNVFFATNTRVNAHLANITGVMSFAGSTSNVSNVNIYNNTIYNLMDTNSSNAASLLYVNGSGVQADNVSIRNNLYYNNLTSFYQSKLGDVSGENNVCSHDYRNATTWSNNEPSGYNDVVCSNVQTATGNPFVSVIQGSENFQLLAPTQAGYTLPYPYNQDCSPKLLNGPTASCKTRGADGVWDRGANEYGGGISSPKNVRLTN
jgi:hypothetical protein